MFDLTRLEGCAYGTKEIEDSGRGIGRGERGGVERSQEEDPEGQKEIGEH